MPALCGVERFVTLPWSWKWETNLNSALTKRTSIMENSTTWHWLRPKYLVASGLCCQSHCTMLLRIPYVRRSPSRCELAGVELEWSRISMSSSVTTRHKFKKTRQKVVCTCVTKTNVESRAIKFPCCSRSVCYDEELYMNDPALITPPVTCKNNRCPTRVEVLSEPNCEKL